MIGADFREIAHCGSQFIVTIGHDDKGALQYSLGLRQSRPVRVTAFAVYALQQGIPVGMVHIGGIGQPFNPPPFPGCFSIFIASDSEGRIGHECPRCHGYWRSSGPPARWQMTCPYCGIKLEGHRFLTKGQRLYVEACCELIGDALNSEQDGEKIIDMDAASDATAGKTERPKFYYAEQSQQTPFTCAACGEWNDILGRFGYCSSCGTRNDLAQLDALIVAIRAGISGPAADLNGGVRDLVSAFDTMAQQYAKQLVEYVPLTARRKARFQGRFHDLRRAAEDFATAFDIRLLDGLDEDTVKFAVMMFERRHVYEHKGGEADETYIEKSGDTSVRVKQIIRETPESVHRLATIIARLGRNLHEGFHELFPAEAEPVEIKRQMDKNRAPRR